MKTQQFKEELKSKSKAELCAEIIALRREQFNLRMQRKNSQETMRSHNFKRVRHAIAFIKTILNERARESSHE